MCKAQRAACIPMASSVSLRAAARGIHGWCKVTEGSVFCTSPLSPYQAQPCWHLRHFSICRPIPNHCTGCCCLSPHLLLLCFKALARRSSKVHMEKVHVAVDGFWIQKSLFLAALFFWSPPSPPFHHCGCIVKASEGIQAALSFAVWLLGCQNWDVASGFRNVHFLWVSCSVLIESVCVGRGTKGSASHASFPPGFLKELEFGIWQIMAEWLERAGGMRPCWPGVRRGLKILECRWWWC